MDNLRLGARLRASSIGIHEWTKNKNTAIYKLSKSDHPFILQEKRRYPTGEHDGGEQYEKPKMSIDRLVLLL